MYVCGVIKTHHNMIDKIIGKLMYLIIKAKAERKENEKILVFWFVRKVTLMDIILFATIYVAIKCFFHKDMIYGFIGPSFGRLVYDVYLYYRKN